MDDDRASLRKKAVAIVQEYFDYSDAIDRSLKEELAKQKSAF